MQQQLRTSQDTSEETKTVHDPELPDELLIQSFVMNYQMCKKGTKYREEADVWIRVQMRRWTRKIYDSDFGKMEAAEVGWTDEPKSLPHFSSCCFFLLVLGL